MCLCLFSIEALAKMIPLVGGYGFYGTDCPHFELETVFTETDVRRQSVPCLLNLQGALALIE